MKSVLIVDDDSDLLKLYTQVFLNANLSVTSIQKINEAQELIVHQKFDIILLDLLFPNTDSLETIRLIRSSGSMNTKTPIIAMTSLDAGEITKKAIEYGANECLFKPDQTPKTIFEAALKLSENTTV